MSSPRLNRYIPLAREFSTRVILFHEAIAENVGLHVTDVKALLMLAAAPMAPTQLAERLGLTGAAVTALVDRLLAAGFATRERDEEDRRRVTVRAVPAHIRKIERLYDAYSAEIAKILASYDAKEFALLEDYLTRTTRLLTEQAAALRERARYVGGV
jgi:DNA-binding MarR family transcriptional regulator